MKSAIRIGTRGSSLALQQTQWTVETLNTLYPELAVEVEVVRTIGDQVQDRPLDQLGIQGAFTKELDLALLNGQVDVVVHSLKDLPTKTPDGLIVAAVPEREDPRDTFIGKEGRHLSEIPQGSEIGTSSLRRRAQLLALRRDLAPVDMRGNVDTRLRKLQESDRLGGIILAAAGLRRLGLAQEVTEYLDMTMWLPAPGQGALAIMTRADDENVRDMVAPLEHVESRIAVTAERALLSQLQGGCHVPVGAFATVQNGELVLDGLVASPESGQVVRDQVKGSTSEAKRLGETLADTLLSRGGDVILHALAERPSMTRENR